MRHSGHALVVLGAVVLLALPTAAAGAPSSSTVSRQRATLQGLRTAVNARKPGATAHLFTASAVLHDGKQTVKGRTAIERWWAHQIKSGLQVTFISPIQIHRASGNVLTQWKTASGTCAHGCPTQLAAHFSGAQLQTLTIAPAQTSSKPTAMPTAPANPPSGPPPKTTPTIPT
jgi:hypothetical protein